VKYIKEKIKDGVNLHLIINDNFKTDFTVVFLSVPLEKEYVTKNALLPAVIKDGSTSFPNYKKLTEELEMMYGASFDCGIDKNGDNLILKFYIETINDNYLPKENDNINKSIKILLDLICNPLIENNGFKKEYVDLEKKNLELLINSQKDDKNIYAFEKCINIMYKNSGYGLSKYGKIEDLEQITEHNLYEQYKKLLNEAKIDIFISGNFEQEKISNEVKENKFIKTLIPRQEQINTNHYKNEIKEKKKEITELKELVENRETSLNKRDELLTEREKNLEEKDKDLLAKQKEIQEKDAKMESILKEQIELLESISGFSKEKAKDLIMRKVEDEMSKEIAIYLRERENDAKLEADKKAKEYIVSSMQKYATDVANEQTVTTVTLPNDEMKGRIIGREGRNIRAIESLTGVDLIIDDTPETITLSSFEPVRREIARLALERLVADGRIHPARIEEMVEKVRRDMDITIKDEGEAASFDTGVFGLHPELIKLLGRLKYRTSYGQNVYKHSIEVSQLAGLMAQELGLDVTLAKRAGLLHDIGKAVDHEQEGTHIQLGADLAKKYRESNKVINAIAAHHGDVEPTTIEAVLVAAADAISGARPGARRETGTNYVKRLEKLEAIAGDFNGVEKCYAIQAGREVRVMVKPEQIDDAQAVFLAKDIAKKIEAELEYPGQIKVNVIREFRASEFAK